MSRSVNAESLVAAFASRFAVGFLVPLSLLPLPGPIAGGLIGLLISLPDAIVTKSYAPILGVGVLGGALIGWLGAAHCPLAVCSAATHPYRKVVGARYWHLARRGI